MTVAQTMLQKYLDAEAAVLDGQEVRFQDRILTMANLGEIQRGREQWQRTVNAELAQAQGISGTRSRFTTVRLDRS
jgi:hypothetical protein